MEILIPLAKTDQISWEAARQLDLRALANRIADEYEKNPQTGSLSYFLENDLPVNRNGLYAEIAEVCYQRLQESK